MKNKIIQMLACCGLVMSGLACCSPCRAQVAHFTSSGRIEYVKTVNMFAFLARDIEKDDVFASGMIEEYKKNHKQFKKAQSSLVFGGSKTLFVPENLDGSSGWIESRSMVSQNNTIFSDLVKQTSVTAKQVFEEKFLIADSMRRIKWKITDENREIAGFPCRRANAVVMDSIYVVAFYTDQIPVSGGPESFAGLPGMILGVALPHENISWFASSVKDMSIEQSQLVPPQGKKVITNAQLKTQLKSLMKNWGKYARTELKGFML